VVHRLKAPPRTAIVVCPAATGSPTPARAYGRGSTTRHPRIPRI
jgi:hypothetical protein